MWSRPKQLLYELQLQVQAAINNRQARSSPDVSRTKAHGGMSMQMVLLSFQRCSQGEG